MVIMEFKYNCPCCGEKTYPVPVSEAVAYICSTCNWENDVFVNSDDEPSDENHGISLNQARENYKKFGSSNPNSPSLSDVIPKDDEGEKLFLKDLEKFLKNL